MDYTDELRTIKKIYSEKFQKFQQDIEISVLTRSDVVERAKKIKAAYNIPEPIYYEDENGKKVVDYYAIKNIYESAPGNLYNKVQALIDKKLTAANVIKLACDEAVQMFNKGQDAFTVSASYTEDGQPNFTIIDNVDIEGKTFDELPKYTQIKLKREIADKVHEEMENDIRSISSNGFVLKKNLEAKQAIVKKEVLAKYGVKPAAFKIHIDKDDVESFKAEESFYNAHPDNTSVRDYYVNKAKQKAKKNILDENYSLDSFEVSEEKKVKRLKEFMNVLSELEEDTSYESYVVQASIFESIAEAELDHLGELTDAEFNASISDVKKKVDKIRRRKKKFAKYYIDENGERPYRDTALIYIKPKWARTGFGVDDFENTTEKVGIAYQDYLEAYSHIIKDHENDVDENGNKKEYFMQIPMSNSGVLSDIVQSSGVGHRKGKNVPDHPTMKVKIAHDEELESIYNFFVNYFIAKCNNNLDEVLRMIDKTINYYKSREAELKLKREEEIKKISSGLYVIKVVNHKLVFKLAETPEEKAEAKKSKQKFERFYLDDSSKTLEEAVRQNVRKASQMFAKQVEELKKEADLKLLAKMPKLNMSEISHRVVGKFEKEIKRVNATAKTQKMETPKSANIVQGFNFEFQQNMNYTINIKKRNKVKNLPNKKQIKQNIRETWAYHMGFPKPTAIFRKSGLKPWPIPESLIKNQILKNNYGNMRAAIFFQLLISNTPVDERYHYEETRVYIKKGKYKKTETEKGIKFERDAEDILSDMVQGAKKVTYTIEREHIPDDERVRDYWEFKYKGITFSMLDSDFQGHDEWFMKPGDLNSIQKVAEVFTKRVKTSKVKGINFTYTNTHPRWERLEYGYYKKDSGPWQGEGKFQREHGVKDHFTYQAPKGWIRLIEAQWNQILETGQDSNILAAVINAEGFNAATVSDEIIKDLKKYESTLGTHEYDYNNFVIIQGE